MARFAVILALLSVNFVAATFIPRAAPGTQFITGPCTTDADCASGCCGVNSAKCAGAIIALTRDGGCGHGDAQSNSRAAAVLRGNCPGTNVKREILMEIEARAPLSPDPNGAKNLGNGAGKQFITGQCASNADCQSGCCATLGSIGICSGPQAADQQGKTGCGFGGAGGAASPPPPPPPVNNGGAAPPAAPAGGLATSGTADVGAACGSDSECKSACCGFNSGKCALAKTAPGSDGGCGKGEAAPNTKAADLIKGNAPIC
ncbi:hypothetical protein E1B28_008079 [Marasmius oreades]|uniref:Biotrophy-associated secreted protein 2 n=1 Tax=Marasmius oreades TaxID=181124 RepID=A0A9P7S2Y1_9AGAR|nr:uncharacterized protein E1B28_008079 [Marasmius oreades]KAG7094481.1 hypothetical protein E1B28_008079 [Marasmius oreades]